MAGKKATGAPWEKWHTLLLGVEWRVREMESGFSAWTAALPTWHQVAIAAATNGAEGAILGALLGIFSNDARHFLGPNLHRSSFQVKLRGSLTLARDFGALLGVNAGVKTLMKSVRGSEDFYDSIVAGFTSGALFFYLCGGDGPIEIKKLIGMGCLFAFLQATGKFPEMLYGHAFSGTYDHAFSGTYDKTRSMLSTLGLGKYESKFNNALIDDSTLPFLTTEDLKELGLPLGARIRILEKINPGSEIRTSEALLKLESKVRALSLSTLLKIGPTPIFCYPLRCLKCVHCHCLPYRKSALRQFFVILLDALGRRD